MHNTIKLCDVGKASISNDCMGSIDFQICGTNLPLRAQKMAFMNFPAEVISSNTLGS